MRITFFIILVLLSGCSSMGSTFGMQHVPDEVALIPNDCSNKPAIERWLVQKVKSPQAFTQSTEEYNRAISYHKRALWNIRYACNGSER